MPQEIIRERDRSSGTSDIKLRERHIETKTATQRIRRQGEGHEERAEESEEESRRSEG